jgi:hypothetical protein
MVVPNSSYRRDIMTKGTKSLSHSERKKYWKKQITGWRKSGQSQVAFCRENELNRWGFLYWRRKLLDNSSGGEAAFVQVPNPLEMKLDQRGTISIEIKCQYRIEVKEGFQAVTLKQILDVLEERQQR